MFKFLDQLEADVKRIGNAGIKPPKGPMQASDKVLGTLKSPALRKLFTLRNNLRDELEKATDQLKSEIRQLGHRHGPNGSECPSCKKIPGLLLLMSRYEAISEIFWAGVRGELPEAQKIESCDQGLTIGLREGWVIVTSPVQEHHSVQVIEVPLPRDISEMLQLVMRHGRPR